MYTMRCDIVWSIHGKTVLYIIHLETRSPYICNDVALNSCYNILNTFCAFKLFIFASLSFCWIVFLRSLVFFSSSFVKHFLCAIFCFTARSSSEFHLNFNVGRFRRSLYYALFVISGWHNILVSSTFIHLNRIFECSFCFICVWVLFHIHAIQFYLDPSCFFSS